MDLCRFNFYKPSGSGEGQRDATDAPFAWRADPKMEPGDDSPTAVCPPAKLSLKNEREGDSGTVELPAASIRIK